MNTVKSSTPESVQCNELTSQKKSSVYENEEEKEKEPVEIGHGGIEECLICSKAVIVGTIDAGCVLFGEDCESAYSKGRMCGGGADYGGLCGIECMERIQKRKKMSRFWLCEENKEKTVWHR